MQRARRLGPATALAGAATALALFGAVPAHAQNCNNGGSEMLPFTCMGTFNDQIFFTLTGPQDFTAFTSNLDPVDPFDITSDPRLMLLNDTGTTTLASDDDGGGDYLVANGSPFSQFIIDTTYTAGGLDALIQNVPLDTGRYRLDVLQSTAGENYRVHLFGVSAD